MDQDSDGGPCCAVCLNDVCGGDRYRKLPGCGHCFLARRIDARFDGFHSTCLLSRAEVPGIISFNENHYRWVLCSLTFFCLFRNFLERACNPLNDELTSMLCASVGCIS